MFRPRCTGALVLALLAACGGADAPRQADAPVLLAAAARGADALVSNDAQASFPGNFADYTVTRTAAGISVTENAGSHVVTVLSAVTKLLFADLTVSTDPAGTAAQVYRLYQAAFGRVPDLAGLGFHISAVDGTGVTLAQLAQSFLDSAEFTARYGALDNAGFLTQLYANILHRSPDSAGLAYWLALLDARTITRAQVLGGFAESHENVLALAATIAAGVAYQPYVVNGAGTAAPLMASAANVAWRAPARLAIVLRDARGTEVPGGHLSCVATDPAMLTVSADCKSASGLRLGAQTVLVSGDGVSAIMTLTVTPQRQLLGTRSNAHYYNLIAASDGTVQAWGYNDDSVLGQGNTALAASALPLNVKNATGTGPLGNIASTIAGETSAIAVTEGGEVVMWASARDFARSDRTSRLPSLVRNPANDGVLQHIVQAAVGQDNAVALADDGSVFTWGDYTGQGDADRRNFPDHPKTPSGTGALTGIVAVAAGGDFSLALGANGKVYAWGGNGSGQTGRGTTNTQEVLPAPVRVNADDTELSNIVAISAGYNFSLALTADGKVYGWGANYDGQLGQDTTTNAVPKAVLVKDATGTGTLGNIVMVVAGGLHGLALDASGRVLSWGYTPDGALGEGANRLRAHPLRPAPVVGTDSTGELGDIVSIGAGRYDSMAVRSNGDVLIWGDGFGFNLGQGDAPATSRSVPVPVKNAAGTGTLTVALAAYPNLLNRGR